MSAETWAFFLALWLLGGLAVACVSEELANRANRRAAARALDTDPPRIVPRSWS
ncbi:MAG: hypothetical protein QOJ92_267 [Frankiales bacterium]|nr:hypothetical protein [Frankiales bacterium]